jgi:Abortive infection alpha
MADDLLGLGEALGKAAGKAIEPLAKEFAELMKLFLRPGTEVAGEMIGNELRYRMWKRYIVLGEKAKKFLEERTIKLNPVPEKLLVPIFLNGGLEDDDDLMEKWAGLLASAAAGDEVHPSFPRILAEVSTTEAKILDALYTRLIGTPPEQQNHILIDQQNLFTIQELLDVIDASFQTFELAIYNLKRLSLVEFPVYNDGVPALHVATSRDIPSERKIKLLPLGQEFVKACQGPLPRE